MTPEANISSSLPIQNLSLDNKSAVSFGSDSGGSEYVTPSTEPSQESTLTSTIASAAPSSQTSADEAEIQKVVDHPSSHDEGPEGPLKIPFSTPLDSCKPVARPNLSADQAEKLAILQKTVEGWTEIATSFAKGAPRSPITDEERMWLTRECMLRYLRATSWSSTAAPQRLMNTLVWRREFKVDSLTAEHVSPEGETGKQVILGFDNGARPCLYLNPGRQNTKKSERQIEHLVYMLERVVEMMPPGQETTALLINFKNSSSSGSPSVGQGKQVLNILQGHYPERLGRACISDLPWYITTFFKLISPFIDPVTKEKMVFNQDLNRHVPPAQLDKDYGGEVDFLYDHAIYFPTLNKMCEERRMAWRDRWIKGGKRVGEYEAYLRGGNQASLSALQQGFSAGKDSIPVDAQVGGVKPRPIGQ